MGMETSNHIRGTSVRGENDSNDNKTSNAIIIKERKDNIEIVYVGI